MGAGLVGAAFAFAYSISTKQITNSCDGYHMSTSSASQQRLSRIECSRGAIGNSNIDGHEDKG